MFSLINYIVYVGQGIWAVELDIIFGIYSQEAFLFYH